MAKTKFPLPAETFPPFTLSQDDTRRLEAAAEAVVKRTVQQYHEHLTVHSGVVDERRWKKIKQREDVRVYRERHAHASATSTVAAALLNTSNSSSRQHHDVRGGDAAADDDDDDNEFTAVSTMLAFGSIQGSLDDIVYGAMSPTTEAMALKSAYVSDHFVDWGVLAPIIPPSATSPFRELSVKWAVKAHPLLVGVVMRTRDILYIESIGMAQTPSGERIGYHLRHSVDVPACRELLEFQIVRAKLSFCHIFRQRKPNCVEVFIRGTISPMGDAPASLTAASTAEVSVSVSRNLHHAEMKKLTRVLASRTSSSTSISTDDGVTLPVASSSSESTADGSSLASSSVELAATGAVVPCALCATSVRSTSAHASSSSSSSKLSFSRTGSFQSKHCRICAARVCARCRVAKTVYVPLVHDIDATDESNAKRLTATTMTFCTRCVLKVSAASSTRFATLDALAMQGASVDYAAEVAL